MPGVKQAHSLSRGRIRPSMNKHNLFNLYKRSKPFFKGMTLFQQKWRAKQETRNYHGEFLTEGQWQREFEHKLDGVAQLDASLKGEVPATPMVLQTFAPLEKRLDVAIFRALFASSVRQARSFVLGGHVKVNNVPIKAPGYKLKPGDMFSVDPEKVLEALGRKKPSLKESYKIDKTQVIKWQKWISSVQENPREMYLKQKNKHANQEQLYEGKLVPELESASAAFAAEQGSTTVKARFGKMEEAKLRKMKEVQNSVTRETILRDIYSSSRAALDASKEVTESTFRKQFGPQLAEKCLQVYLLLSKDKKAMELPSDEVDAEIAKLVPAYVDGKAQGDYYDDTRAKKIRQLLSEINTKYQDKIRKDFSSKPLTKDAIIKMWAASVKRSYHPLLPPFSAVEEKGKYSLHLPWQKGVFGRADPSKAYFTPWRPRQFLAPFAILPKHIEVSFKTCHAIYLRHPVARPGESEVISPFDEDIQERAYMYYVKKGM